jgi:NitT/TauT family transport system substrate-binding protein
VSSISLAQAADRVVVGHGSSQVEITHPGLYLGQAIGLAEAEQLDIEVQLTQGSQQALQLLAAGQVDVVSVNANTVFDGRESGIDIRIVYSSVSHNNNYVAVLADGPYDSIAKLAGTDVGVFSMTSGGVPMLKAILGEAGLGENDVSMVPVGAGPAAIEALASGKISALSLWAGAFAVFENGGADLTLFGSERLDPAPGYVLATTEKYISENPGIIEKLGRIYAQTQLFAETNPKAVVEAYWEAFPENVPPGDREAAMAQQVHILEVGLRDMRTDNRPDNRYGWNNPDGIAILQDYLIENGARSTPLPIEDLYTNQYVDAFNDFDADAIRAAAKAATP